MTQKLANRIRNTFPKGAKITFSQIQNIAVSMGIRNSTARVMADILRKKGIVFRHYRGMYILS